MTDTPIRRILLKISGESLTENGHRGLKRAPVNAIIEEVLNLPEDYQLAIVLGGGNIYRGSQLMDDLELDWDDRIEADWCGMMATHINGIMLEKLMLNRGIDTRLMLAKPYGDVGEVFYRKKAKKHLKKGRVIIVVGGTGKPRFTTDTCAVLTAAEIGADIVLKGTKVDGIYTADPKNPPEGVTPEHIPYITHDEFVHRKLRILDTSAVELARDNRLRIRVFDIFEEGSLKRVIRGKGTYSEIGPPHAKDSKPKGSRMEDYDPLDAPWSSNMVP